MAESDSDLVVAENDDEDLVVAAPSAGVFGGGGRNPGASRQRGRRWKYPSTGTTHAWVVVDSSSPPLRQDAVPPPVDLEFLSEPSCRVALAVAKVAWRLVEASADAHAAHNALHVEGRRAAAALGYMQFEFIDVFHLETPHACSPEQLSVGSHDYGPCCGRLLASVPLVPGSLTPADVMTASQLQSHVLELHPSVFFCYVVWACARVSEHTHHEATALEWPVPELPAQTRGPTLVERLAASGETHSSTCKRFGLDGRR